MSLATIIPTPVDQEAKPRRRRVTQATRSTARPTPKSKDASMVKVSFYLTTETAQLLSIAATICREDQSSLAEKALRQSMPSIENRVRKLLESRGKSDDRASTVEESADAAG